MSIPSVLASEFDFYLPEELIAQRPTPDRGASRLLVLKRQENRIEHRQFGDLLQYLRSGDVLVLNDSRVIPARVRAINPATGGAFEILLLEENSRNDWWAMMRPAKRARLGTKLALIDPSGGDSLLQAEVVEMNPDGHRRLLFSTESDIHEVLDRFGEMPLPPYIKRTGWTLSSEDHTRYQTVFAQEKGSVAAPTAGLHFTNEFLSEIRAHGVQVCFITLHVGPGTFTPVKAERVEEHVMHQERFHVEEEVARTINAAKMERRRVIAVGTTSVRVLETLARNHHGRVVSGSARTNIFIYPPFPFQIVDALLTNFHLPRSTLLMLISALAAPGETNGREIILSAYAEAIREQYRFFSYGDAMLIV